MSTTIGGFLESWHGPAPTNFTTLSQEPREPRALTDTTRSVKWNSGIRFTHRALPDWVVIEVTHTAHDVKLPSIRGLGSRGKIIGDTKVFQRPNTATREEGSPNQKTSAQDNHSCHLGWLAQVQHYAHILGNSFWIRPHKRRACACPILARRRGIAAP